MIVSSVRFGNQWTTVIALAYAFALGLLRLFHDLEWRHVALHNLNFVLTALLVVLGVGELLPYVDINYTQELDAALIGGIATLAAAVVLATSTPREWAPPSIEHRIFERIPTLVPSLEETCSWAGYFLTYEWITPLMLKGFRRQMTIEELPRTPWYDDPLVLLARIMTARSKSKSSFATVLRYLRLELITMAICAALTYSVEMVAPFAMYQLLGYIADPDAATVQPWVWLILLGIGPMIRSFAFQQYVYGGTRTVVRIKSALTQELYLKAMDSMELNDEIFSEMTAHGNGKEKLKLGKNTTATGRIANLMSADVDSIWGARDFVIIGFGVSIGTVLALTGTYKLLGWPALVGIAVMVILFPLPLLISHRMLGINREMKKIQDSRISAVSEYLASIRAIKYFAWEDAVAEKINTIRSGEQQKIWILNVLSVILAQLTEVIPILALLIMFSLYVLVRKQPLTADVAFTTISLVRMMRRNLSMASTSIRSTTAGLVSLRRLDRFFYNTTPLRPHTEGPLQMKNACFRRHKNAAFTLNDISIDFVEGGLNAITGSSGSGKTTLLLAILGETLLESGSITCPKDIAYASQSPWLQNDTIRENILFNSSFEKLRYDRVIEACGLAIDMDEFPERDETEVGENGTSLSGGQKSRVALARALYSKASVILLDDIFSALDAKTSASLWKEAFCGDLLKGRTVVLVTQVPWIGPQADLTIVMENGSIKDSEQNLGVTRHVVAADELLVDEGDVDTTVEVAAAHESETNGALLNRVTSVGLSRAVVAKRQNEVTQEALKTGTMARLQFFSYMSLFRNPAYAIITILMTILSQASLVGTTLWVAVWVEASSKDSAYDVGFYLGIYALFSLGECIFTGITYLAYESGGWYAARTLHNTFMNAVMSVPLSWYKTTPIGRIVNRFSADMNSLDNNMVAMLRMTIVNGLLICFQAGAVSTVLPVFLIPIAICCAVGVFAGEIYTRTSVSIKRLVSSAQSPVFAQFADTLAGLAVIRARAGMPQVFHDQLAAKLRTLARAQEAQFCCNRWVGVRIDFMTTLVSVAAGAIAVSQAGTVAAGLVGFSLSNATTLNSLIMHFVRAMNQTEVELQSYHRVKEYANIEPEEKTEDYKEQGAYTDDPAVVLPPNWPTNGEIEFRKVTIKYDVDGPEILKNINLKFAAGERVAVVGRTGSGKSTLVLSLLRFTNIVSGQIFFNGIDITKFPRRKLREALTIIPQEAVLFTGDVGSNLDPTNKISKQSIEKALDYCRGIASFEFHQDQIPSSNMLINGFTDDDTDANETSALGIHLSTPVKAKGENFSHGQRQVLSLCRALVRKSKLLLLDEATASMDYETDQGIQEVLRKELNEHGRDRTLVTIAHRLKTIIDYDRVVVMGAGEVIEVGSPKELYDRQGTFFDMMRHSGEFDDLEGFLKSKC
ncbi:multidrug resistance-associated protein [Xylariaceae sp. FL1272]|nr:multidrug resistance-associated protein [Xylariaceae sp. FL1272]